MPSYMQLMDELAGMDRCHCGPEMEAAYQQLVSHYTGARLLTYERQEPVYHWKMPPYWACRKAELTDSSGRLIASKRRNNLEVYSYSPAVNTTMSLAELQPHLFSDPQRPDAVCFHFRNQYRHWAVDWGFSLPHSVRESLSPDEEYHVVIESTLDYDRPVIQSDYHHQGRQDDTFVLLGHFDHPSQVNDGLAGCIAAYEVIKRLQNRSTRYSYRAFASVEIVGSVYYLHREPNHLFREGLFLGFSGIRQPLVYQQSYHRRSLIDRIMRYLFVLKNNMDQSIFNHRQLIGNDENIFDSVGYEIPTGTLMRWPFDQYHTHFDNMDITSEESIEEVIEVTLRIIEILEEDRYIKANYKGLPSLANPDIDLYLSVDAISGVSGSSRKDVDRFYSRLRDDERDYLVENSHLLNQFMQNMVRLADGNHTLLDVAEKSLLPFGFVLMYARMLEEKSIISLGEMSD